MHKLVSGVRVQETKTAALSKGFGLSAFYRLEEATKVITLFSNSMWTRGPDKVKEITGMD